MHRSNMKPKLKNIYKFILNFNVSTKQIYNAISLSEFYIKGTKHYFVFFHI